MPLRAADAGVLCPKQKTLCSQEIWMASNILGAQADAQVALLAVIDTA